MSEQFLVGFGRDALFLTLLAASPLLVTGLVVGLSISLFQSVTQIQDITLTFVPKIIAVIFAFVAALPWIMGILIRFSVNIFRDFSQVIQ